MKKGNQEDTQKSQTHSPGDSYYLNQNIWHKGSDDGGGGRCVKSWFLLIMGRGGYQICDVGWWGFLRQRAGDKQA